MTISNVIALYRAAGKCDVCFRGKMPFGRMPESGCRLPQPRYIGSQYWGSKERVVVCMVNPGAGHTIEEEFEKVLREFYSSKEDNFYKVNDYIYKAMQKWGGGRYVRAINHWLELKIQDIAIMNIALCPMVDAKGNNFYPEDALFQCFTAWTCGILRELEPKTVILCGSSLQQFKGSIEERIKCRVIRAPHYAARIPLSEMQQQYGMAVKILRDGT